MISITELSNYYLQENPFPFSDNDDINNLQASPQYNDVDNESTSHQTMTAGGNLTDHTNDNGNDDDHDNANNNANDNDNLSTTTKMGSSIIGQAIGPVPFRSPPASKPKHNHSQYNNL